MQSTAIMPRASIDEIIGLRGLSLAKFREGYDLLREARELAYRAAPNGHFPTIPDRVKRLLESCSEVNGAEYEQEMTKIVDQSIWDHIVNSMGIERLMDAQAREKFRHDLQTNPPEVSFDNVRATVESLVGDADLIFRRGIANAFAKLDRRFRTHDAFKVGSKVIFDYAMNQYGSWSRGSSDTLRDVERTFYVLDGKEMPERYAGIIGVIDAAKPRGFELSRFDAENDYFKVRIFKNGNMHVWLKRDDLVEKVNQLLAEYYGATLGDASEEAREASWKPGRAMTPAKNFGFFPTPDALADNVIDTAWIKEGMTVLEPNAGSGALSRRALAQGGIVTCVEVQPHLVHELEADSRYAQVLCMDFLELTPELTGQFDRIVMNPPFDKGLDVAHVDHALDFLAPGGHLVAIMSAGAEFRTDARSTAFRNKIERMRGSFSDLPAGSFQSVGTMVNTVLLTVRKN